MTPCAQKAPTLRFVQPDESLRGEIEAFAQSFYAAGEDTINGSGGLDFFPSFATWLRYLRRVEAGEEEGLVPSVVRFAQAEGGRLLGVVDIRPALPAEKLHFGHVGYATAPPYRGRGVGSAMLAWALAQLRGAGVGDIIACCYADNLPSRRVLEKGGFARRTARTEEETGKRILEYRHSETIKRSGKDD
ncbi:GNAT family N-acetyltransferase [Ruminococcaceae bacterium OttesenSCG-928-O06]|nr:GNAT family N-acetyltransferase [Ruminococcaceae bacterium OttesenSCG-928-O06]